MYRMSNMETYITMCKIDSQWEFAVWLRKLKQGLCIKGREIGGRFKREGIYISVQFSRSVMSDSL